MSHTAKPIYNAVDFNHDSLPQTFAHSQAAFRCVDGTESRLSYLNQRPPRLRQTHVSDTVCKQQNYPK
jgi:hypothetical protein